MRRDDDPQETAGPSEVEGAGEPEAVWLTAESLGDEDPAMAAHPDLPVIFVFDEPLLTGLRLSAARLVFLVETLADLADRRDVMIHRGDPIEVLAERPLATTFAPVPGWRRRAADLSLVEVHPWPWLVRPHAKSVTSFTAWRRSGGAVKGAPAGR
jgi:deoxyribodipyrimidine photo-lyase